MSRTLPKGVEKILGDDPSAQELASLYGNALSEEKREIFNYIVRQDMSYKNAFETLIENPELIEVEN